MNGHVARYTRWLLERARNLKIPLSNVLLYFIYLFFFLFCRAQTIISFHPGVLPQFGKPSLSLFFPGKLESISKIDCQGITSRLFPLYVNPLSRALHNILLLACMCKVNLYFSLFLHSLWRDKEEEEKKE